MSNASSSPDVTRRDGSALPVQMIRMGNMARNSGSVVPAVMRERGARCFSSGADADSCGMDVGREAFDETGHLSFSQFDYLDRYCAGAGSALLTKPGCHIVSRRNATKIDCRPGGAVAQGRLALRSGAHCDTDEGLGAQTTFATRMAGVDFRMGLARYVEQLRFLRQMHAHAAMLKLSIGDRVPCRGHDRDEVKCVGAWCATTTRP
ncbi:TPA: hypothetical protein QDA93_001256 [Burkholderia vietnamiensis]|uniref:hypothetical protein n=1 Tax=Burkholderia vietnamiensis TaxID=60552 RepID=UPI001593B6A6|nr:hypothetical protein [Burkholderia vietnamiensis]MCA8068978.1 hypothetical protein [Burkholderia vietnamiensis]HDR8988674.1 hypothetical protein [Burkholderia vietnamiensis]